MVACATARSARAACSSVQAGASASTCSLAVIADRVAPAWSVPYDGGARLSTKGRPGSSPHTNRLSPPHGLLALRPPGAEIAVGTGLAARPPRRSQRARLAHWAPALGSGVKAHVGPGVNDLGAGEPCLGDAVHPLQGHGGALAAAPERAVPVALYLVAECLQRVDVVGHPVVAVVPGQDAFEPASLFGDRGRAGGSAVRS